MGTKSFRTLEEYADDFWEFLKAKNNQVVPEKNKKKYVFIQTHNYLQTLYCELDKKVTQYVKENSKIDTATTLPLLYEILDEKDSLFDDTAFLENANPDNAGSILKEWKSEFAAATCQCLEELFDSLPEERKEQIYRQISLLFVKSRFILKNTGVVIAGYGTSEIFPKIASFWVEGVIGNHIKMALVEGKSNLQDDEFATKIIPFAQDEVVWTFLGGIAPDIHEFVITYWDDLLTAEDQKSLENFEKKMSNHLQMGYTQPVLDMVSVLPKSDLAAMAESLVNLTVFKRKISKSIETVAGPIDVAVISRADGFIWVKRKHYFQPELNQHFFANYFRRANNGKER